LEIKVLDIVDARCNREVQECCLTLLVTVHYASSAIRVSHHGTLVEGYWKETQSTQRI